MMQYQHKVNPWQEVRREEIFSLAGRSIEKVIFRLPGGETKDFYIHNERSTVCVFALKDAKEVVLVEQYRPGPKKVLRELPGGYIDNDETPLQAIRREFQEETGFSGDFMMLGHSFHSAYSTRIKYYFIATSCRKHISPQPEDSEKYSRVVLLELDDFLRDLRSGDVTDADCAYAALNYLKSSQED